MMPIVGTMQRTGDNSSIQTQPGLAGSIFLWFDLSERRICLWLNRPARSGIVVRLFATVSRLGDGLAWYTLMAMLALTQGASGRMVAAQMALAGICGVIIYKALKRCLVRERPFVTSPDILLGTAPLDRYSFPSGHTLHAVLFSVLAITWFPALAPVLVPFAMLIALSRVILGLHYPSDVVVGAIIGWSLAELALVVVAPG